MSLYSRDDLTLKEVMNKLLARFAPKVRKIYCIHVPCFIENVKDKGNQIREKLMLESDYVTLE